VVGVVRGMDLDAYLTGFVAKNPVWSLLSVASVLALVIVVLRHAFAVVFFVSENLSLREAVLRAQDVGRHHAVGDVAALVLVPNLLMVALSLVLLIPLLPFLALSGTVHLATDVFCALTVIVDAVVALPFSYATMLTLLEGRGKASGRPEVPATGAVGRMVPALTGFLVVASLVGIAVFVHRSVVVPLQGDGPWTARACGCVPIAGVRPRRRRTRWRHFGRRRRTVPTAARSTCDRAPTAGSS
jgi:hypothetical protein